MACLFTPFPQARHKTRFPASFKQESGSCLSLKRINALFPVGVACDAAFFYEKRVADHHSATLFFVEADF
ncbi:hypothetical protein ACS74_05385 [Exiguobacterium acetylicum]|nr:hypothetical protein ACS74_05385 [Exiguobacterium acetylicum]